MEIGGMVNINCWFSQIIGENGRNGTTQRDVPAGQNRKNPKSGSEYF
jgi:hypothetical protein